MVLFSIINFSVVVVIVVVVVVVFVVVVVVDVVVVVVGMRGDQQRVPLDLPQQLYDPCWPVHSSEPSSPSLHCWNR